VTGEKSLSGKLDSLMNAMSSLKENTEAVQSLDSLDNLDSLDSLEGLEGLEGDLFPEKKINVSEGVLSEDIGILDGKFRELEGLLTDFKTKYLCNGESGTADCCTAERPCKVGDGDCDKDQDCAGDLVCGKDNCQEFNWKAKSSYDCCMEPKVCTGERGTGECCTKDSPCKVGGGDCDKDEDCAGDLVCGKDNCRDFNWFARSSYDCCIKNKD